MSDFSRFPERKFKKGSWNIVKLSGFVCLEGGQDFVDFRWSSFEEGEWIGANRECCGVGFAVRWNVHHSLLDKKVVEESRLFHGWRHGPPGNRIDEDRAWFFSSFSGQLAYKPPEITWRFSGRRDPSLAMETGCMSTLCLAKFSGFVFLWLGAGVQVMDFSWTGDTRTVFSLMSRSISGVTKGFFGFRFAITFCAVCTYLLWPLGRQCANRSMRRLYAQRCVSSARFRWMHSPKHHSLPWRWRGDSSRFFLQCFFCTNGWQWRESLHSTMRWSDAPRGGCSLIAGTLFQFIGQGRGKLWITPSQVWNSVVIITPVHNFKTQESFQLIKVPCDGLVQTVRYLPARVQACVEVRSKDWPWCDAKKGTIWATGRREGKWKVQKQKKIANRAAAGVIFFSAITLDSPDVSEPNLGISWEKKTIPVGHVRTEGHWCVEWWKLVEDEEEGVQRPEGWPSKHEKKKKDSYL